MYSTHDRVPDISGLKYIVAPCYRTHSADQGVASNCEIYDRDLKDRRLKPPVSLDVTMGVRGVGPQAAAFVDGK